MVMSILTTELAKIALNKLGELKIDDATKALQALSRSGRGALLVPGLGTLGVGIAIGAGIGMLIAPRPGAETRAALRDSVRSKLAAIRGRLSRAPVVEEVEAKEPNGQRVASN